MSMARREIVAALTLAALTAWYAYLTTGLPERSLPNTPGPSFFPWVITFFLAALTLALFVKGARGMRAEAASGERGPPPRREALAIGAFALYLVVLMPLGFILSTMAFFAAFMVIYGARHPLLVALTSIVVPLALYTLFRHGLTIVLPRGLLSF